MITVITIVTWVLIAALFLLALVLAMPLRIELELSKAEAVRFSAALRPFGRYGPRIALSDQGKKRAKTKSKKELARKSRWKHRPKQIAGAAISLVMELIGRVRIESADLDLKFGLGDPAETGHAYGKMTPLIYGVRGVPRVHINVDPTFDRAILEGRVSVDMSLIPLTLVPPLVRFGWVVFRSGR